MAGEDFIFAPLCQEFIPYQSKSICVRWNKKEMLQMPMGKTALQAGILLHLGESTCAV